MTRTCLSTSRRGAFDPMRAEKKSCTWNWGISQRLCKAQQILSSQSIPRLEIWHQGIKTSEDFLISIIRPWCQNHYRQILEIYIHDEKVSRVRRKWYKNTLYSGGPSLESCALSRSLTGFLGSFISTSYRCAVEAGRSPSELCTGTAKALTLFFATRSFQER